MEEKKKKRHGVRLSWWLVVLAVVVFGSVFAIIKVNKNTSTPIKKQPDTADEIKIKQNISSMRGDIVRYFETNKTYEGWNLDPNVEKLVTNAGSSLKTKLTKDSYMVYAKMPSSKLTFCIDNSGTNGFTDEVYNVSTKTCK